MALRTFLTINIVQPPVFCDVDNANPMPLEPQFELSINQGIRTLKASPPVASCNVTAVYPSRAKAKYSVRQYFVGLLQKSTYCCESPQELGEVCRPLSDVAAKISRSTTIAR
jgi:hypothetical protein